MRPFDHDRLDVYHRAIDFVAWATELLDGIPKGHAVHKQLDRAATSIPLNIAEGHGKFTAADQCRYLDMARGAALECAACLDVLVAKGTVDRDGVAHGKELLLDIVSMLVGLIRSNSPERSV